MLLHLLRFLREWYLSRLKKNTSNSPLGTRRVSPEEEIYPPIRVQAESEADAAYHSGKWEEAERLCRTILASEPRNIEVLNLLGNIVALTERPHEAVNLLSLAASLNPSRADIQNNLGIAVQSLGRFEEALEIYQRAIALRPGYAEAFVNRGNVQADLYRHQEALQSYEQAIVLKPGFADTYINRGNSLSALKRNEEALESYEQAIALDPEYGEAYYNRGETLLELNRPEAAFESLQHALKLRPDHENLYGLWLHTKMSICNWEDFESDLAGLSERIGRGERASTPFPVLGISGSPALQKRASEIWLRAEHPSRSELPVIAKRPAGKRVRIGYFSADFHDHATSRLIAEMFEKHDKSRFELSAFSFGPDIRDAMRKRVSDAFDNFIDARGLSDSAVATRARNLEIDIAVDLKGYCQDSRTGIFSLRAAPLQISYLGYPGTMGAEYIDYLIADATLIPESLQQYYSEKIIYLPYSYQANDTTRPISISEISRGEMGLPENGFVFCCFNNNFKITPEFFDRWMRILKQVNGSVLWLLEDNPGAARNLRDEAARRDVDATRLVFAKRVPLPEHLARHRLADLFLDTLPCNAHTTASDALRAGLPVLTCLGEAFAGRVAGSLLKAALLPELIASTVDEYESLAIDLAGNPTKLLGIKQRLAVNRLTAPLFDIEKFTRHIEAGYVAAYERYQANLPPEHIHIRSD